MKKILAMLLALAVSCAMFSACSFGDSSSKSDNTDDFVGFDNSSKTDDPSSDADNSENLSSDGTSSGDESSDPEEVEIPQIVIENETPLETDKRMFEELIQTAIDVGEYTVNTSIEQGGASLVMYLTSDGESTFVDMTFMGVAITALTTADGEYILDTESNKYYFDPEGSMGIRASGEGMLDSMTSIEGLTYLSTSAATIDGSEYTVERYTNDKTSVEVSYIFDAEGKLAFVGNDGLYMPFELYASADADKLSIDGYTEMTEEEFVSWYSEKFGIAVE